MQMSPSSSHLGQPSTSPDSSCLPPSCQFIWISVSHVPVDLQGLCISFSVMRVIWPAHLNLPDFITLTPPPPPSHLFPVGRQPAMLSVEQHFFYEQVFFGSYKIVSFFWYSQIFFRARRLIRGFEPGGCLDLNLPRRHIDRNKEWHTSVTLINKILSQFYCAVATICFAYDCYVRDCFDNRMYFRPQDREREAGRNGSSVLSTLAMWHIEPNRDHK
jgi:hypothetical protein